MIAAREVPLFTDDSQAIEWFPGLIDREPAVAGPSQRDAMSPGGLPLLTARWRVPIADHPYLEGAVKQYRRLLKEREDKVDVPTLRPLAVGHVVLMRTLRKLLAVDLVTGKRLWEAPPDDGPELLDDASGQDDRLKIGLRRR